MIATGTPSTGDPVRNPEAAQVSPIAVVRTRLRLVTASAHARLHTHSGFAAATAGMISLSDYRLLLSRLFGFHRAFETVHTRTRYLSSDDLPERVRSHLIAADLQSLGVDACAISRLPLCESLYAPSNEAEELGARYVLEGSTLGGAHIARALKAVVPGADEQGRRFFLGYGARHGAMWRTFVESLERLSAEPGAIADAECAAIRTFDEFEHWMSGWKAVRSSSIDAVFDSSP